MILVPRPQPPRFYTGDSFGDTPEIFYTRSLFRQKSFYTRSFYTRNQLYTPEDLYTRTTLHTTKCYKVLYFLLHNSTKYYVLNSVLRSTTKSHSVLQSRIPYYKVLLGTKMYYSIVQSTTKQNSVPQSTAPYYKDRITHYQKYIKNTKMPTSRQLETSLDFTRQDMVPRS